MMSVGIYDTDSLKAQNHHMLRQYHLWRRKNELTETQQKIVDELISDWKFYRSNEPMTVYTAYGLYEHPVTYMTEQEIDQYVIEDAEYYELDDFQYCVEPVIMTGAQFGELLAEW